MYKIFCGLKRTDGNATLWCLGENEDRMLMIGMTI